eukprot:289264_1
MSISQDDMLIYGFMRSTINIPDEILQLCLQYFHTLFEKWYMVFELIRDLPSDYIHQFSIPYKTNKKITQSETFLGPNSYSPSYHSLYCDNSAFIFKIEGANNCIYNITTNTMNTLPPIPKSFYRTYEMWGHQVLYSMKHETLIVIGSGYNDNEIVVSLPYSIRNDFNANCNIEWKELAEIDSSQHNRFNMSACLWQNESKIFVAGGYTSLCDIYDFEKDEWIRLDKQLIYGNKYRGIMEWKNRNNNLIIGGGYFDTKVFEEYDAIKNKFIELPPSNHCHYFYPMLSVCNYMNGFINSNYGVLLCVGNDGAGSYTSVEGVDKWGYIEFIDVRDNKQKWITIDSLEHLLGY